MSASDEAEKRWIEYEDARNDALSLYFNARPHLNCTREQEAIFIGGFRIAWELLKNNEDE